MRALFGNEVAVPSIARIARPENVSVPTIVIASPASYAQYPQREPTRLPTFFFACAYHSKIMRGAIMVKQ